jgi:hypothetical protein
MMVNAWCTQQFDMPPGYVGYGGGWHAVRARMNSIGVYDTATEALLAVGALPTPNPVSATAAATEKGTKP